MRDPGSPLDLPDTDDLADEAELPDGEALAALEDGVDYRARKVRWGLYLVHWIVGEAIHLAILLDFEDKETIGAALMPGQWEMWDIAWLAELDSIVYASGFRRTMEFLRP